MNLILDPEIKIMDGPNTKTNVFNKIMLLKGKVYRELENRCTQRIQLHDKPYFIKQHFGVGWKEIFKNLFQLRWPVLSANNEFKAIQLLKNLNIPTLEMVGFGLKGINPARRRSFLITRELPPFITLEDLCKDWRIKPPSFSFKYDLIKEVARIARILHKNGINHRDFYICHFLLDLIQYNNNKALFSKEHSMAGLKTYFEKNNLRRFVKLYLIDLHRAQIRKATPERWIIKDLAGLYFSSKNIGLTKRDLWRFIKHYCEQSLDKIFNEESKFWMKVKNRGEKLYRDHERS